MNFPLKNNTWFFVLLLALTVLTYGFFEVWVANEEIPERKRQELANEAINTAIRNYSAFEYHFIEQSNRFTQYLTDQVEQSQTPGHILSQAAEEYDFWGFSIFKDEQLWLWSNFGEQNYLLPPQDTTYVNIRQVNNVTFLSFRKPFFVQVNGESIRYDVFTRKKIQQENILSIGDDSELTPNDLFHSPGDYPVHFNFFKAPPENPQFQAKISTQSVDSVGVAYTLADDFSEYKSARQNRYYLYRAGFYVIIIILVTLFLISISKKLSTWKSLFLKLFALTLAWLFFVNLEYGVGWIELFYALGQQHFLDFKPLIRYGIHAIFMLLVTIVCFNPILYTEVTLRKPTKNFFPSILAVFGFLSFSLLLFFLTETYELFIESSISVLDLNVFPTLDTFLFYLVSGLFAISSTALLTILGWFFLKISPYSTWVSKLIMAVGFLSGVALFGFTQIIPAGQHWLLVMTIIYFMAIMSFVFVTHRNPALFSYISRLRILLLFSYLCVCITYVSVYKGYSERLNSQMENAAQLFINEEESQAELIARQLLTGLEQSLSSLSKQDFEERPAYVENIFVQQTRNLISIEWESFSISTQLVNNSGEIVGEYSSDLDSPAWTRAFDMLSLVIPFEEERIRLENLRPIIRERPLNEANSNYSSFRRAWIPLYDSQNPLQRLGWILCSVYRERPQLEKPLRAVLASEGSENWNASINVTEYIEGRSSRNNIAGIPLELPGYSRLPAELVEKVQQDSLLYRITDLSDQQIREFFVATSPQRIIRAATNHPGLENHLFSLIRYFFCILFSGLFILGAFSWKKDLNILGHNRRFRDRLIDRFIFASLLCLMALTATTYYAIKNQNQKSVQDQLLDKLKNLSEAISLQTGELTENTAFQLNQLTSTLDADAAIYSNHIIQTSTTSQIYNQHLLPQLIPWDVHQSIYEKGNNQVTRIITLGRQKLLIGYQPIETEEGEIAGIVAIPTFLEAPKFNEQLLSTTSYLLGFYVIIFGLFIVGAALISTQLTKPLEALREGLRKISGGDLETTLPVRSRDEIGSLTNAYNVMVYRLKDLQEELARAEREAAWKEMAQQVAHEIKNPLTPMKLNLQHLERQLKTSKEDFIKMKPNIERIAANMIEQIESLNQIASDFSKFAKPIEQEFQPVEINELLVSIAELYEPEKKLVMKKELYKGEIWISGVKDELRRVLINLVKNAYEAMPKSRGTLTLSSQINGKSDSVLILVMDDGEGIPAEHQNRIFIPNFSTKSSGTGLGLAISKKIIEEHGGHISFTSTPGEGTTFTVELPLKSE